MAATLLVTTAKNLQIVEPLRKGFQLSESLLLTNDLKALQKELPEGTAVRFAGAASR